MPFPNLEGVRDQATRENLRYIDERSLLVQVGDVILAGTNTSRPGFRPANFDEVSRTEYNELFATIGTSGGAGDGVTTFNLWNLTGTEPIPQLTYLVRVK